MTKGSVTHCLPQRPPPTSTVRATARHGQAAVPGGTISSPPGPGGNDATRKRYSPDVLPDHCGGCRMSPPPGTLHAPTSGSAVRTGAGASTGQPTTGTLAKYKTETQAKQACAGDTVVWANTSSKALHASGDKYYGHTKRGAYVCQSAAQNAGYHLAQ